MGALWGFSHGFESRPPHAPSPSLFCNGAESPLQMPKNRFQKDFVVSNTRPLFRKRDGGELPGTRPQKQKVRAAIRTKHLEPKGVARGENTVTARERGVG